LIAKKALFDALGEYGTNLSWIFVLKTSTYMVHISRATAPPKKKKRFMIFYYYVIYKRAFIDPMRILQCYLGRD